jgi:hypothetical protein
MKNSVSAPPFAPHAVAGLTAGAIDAFDYVDALPDLVPHPRPMRVPLGAPLVVGGWAADPGSAEPPLAVSVVLDGARPHPAESGLSRGDIAALHPNTPELVGFRAVVPTAGLQPGGHEVRAYALAADGAWYEAAYRPFWLAATPLLELAPTPRRVRIGIEQIIDLAPDGALLGFDAPVACGRFALLTGWAIDPATRNGVAGVIAFDPQGRPWSAPCDIVRPDLRGALDAVGDRLGFEMAIPTDALGRGRHRLRLTGYDAEGRLFDGRFEATLDVAGPPRPFPAFPRLHRTEAPAAAVLVVLGDDGTRGPPSQARGRFAATLERGVTALVEGWALDVRGAGAGTVFVELAPPEGGVPPHRFASLAGYRRDEPAPRVPKPPVGDAWFSARIDTTHLPRRAYELALAVVDEDRRAYARRVLGTLTVV